ncbi:hypothetical protein GOBAR_AA19794 [Gossypium barbadense]|uniref:Uncharacterized protein n=1 Tax=Gossypium barbadense TaxID=3634 RepID=A0A2P5XC24_GOSBA|nr:hypothetical protein GOBAR_AA19794 [Gossypium barbadense]
MAKAQRPHIAILPSPGMGHLIPLVEFAKRLVHQHSFTVTFVIPTDGSPSKALKSTLDSLPTFIDSVFLPPVDLSDLPPDSKIETGMISLTAFMSMVAGAKLVGLVVDMTPNDTIANATYINVDTQKDDDPFMFLPKGFVERTKERSLVVGSWVPQARVLNHGSTGGFLTHCGWNQFLKDAKVALTPKPNKNGLICRDEIAKIVKCLMGSEEGKSVRNRMLELKEAAKRVLCENGSSTIALFEVADSINHPLLSTS